jgi:hypothetical protein
MNFPERCRACPECNIGGNPCDGCCAGGICDGAVSRCTCNDEPYESPLDECEYDPELEP